ncbi:MAG: class I SAM-dependent methyltransferase [Gammaproteobacteria bacterium]|nr:class I SAM-dependent methyltransferase [Gammaproteobacteria bacterium]
MAFELLDRSIHLPTTTAQLTQRTGSTHDDWLMTDAERGTLQTLVRNLKPQCAIEVGVYRAGSLAILSANAAKVYALDIDPSCAERYAPQFPNVEFVIGDSGVELPALLDRLQTTGAPLDFILIDADHSEDGVRRDIESVLRYRPKRPLYVVMHDSFNPGCRRGMKRAKWAANPHVHHVELDFVPGRFVTREKPGQFRQMWCGLALAILLPEERRGELTLHENEGLLFQSTLRQSAYRYHKWWNPMYMRKQFRPTVARMLKEHAPGLYGSLKRRMAGTATGTS